MTAPEPTAPDLDEPLADHVHEAWEAANTARREHLDRSLLRATHLIRRHHPSAAALSVDLIECIPRTYHRASLVALHDDTQTIWHADADADGAGIPQADLHDIETALTDCLSFGVDQDVLREAGWKVLGTDDYVWDVTLPTGDLRPPARPVPTVWVLRHGTDARYDAEVTLHATEEEGLAVLAGRVRQTWYRVTDIDDYDVPDEAPVDDREAVEAYFAARQHEESEEPYSLYDVDVPGLSTGASGPSSTAP